MRFCNNCGRELSDDKVFCPTCGTRVGEAGPGAQQAPTAPFVASSPVPVQAQYGAPVPQPQESRNMVPVVIAIVAAVIVIAAAVLLFVFKPWEMLNQDSDGTQVVSAERVDGTQDAGESSQAASQAASSAASSSAASQSASSSSASSKSSSSSASSSSSSSSSKSSSSSSSSDYVLPESSTREYSKSELEKLSDHDLFLARNEIYARHGRGFKNEELQRYFGGKSWYKETIAPEDFQDSYLNDVERKNANRMLEIEKDRNSPYLS